MAKRLLTLQLIVSIAVSAYACKGAASRVTASTNTPAADVSPTGTITVGHLVGVCAASLVVASMLGYFKDEGLDVRLQWTPNPGDAMAQLQSGAIQFWNGSFTAVYRAIEQGLKARIVAGAGIEGVSVLARKGSGINSMDDLVARRRNGLRIGTQRLNTIEMTMFGALANRGLGYDDFQMKFFADHFSMSAAFVKGEIDVVSHIEPYASQFVSRHGAVTLVRSADVWGPGSPECVTSVRADFLASHPDAVKRYIRALLRADRFIKANRDEALNVMEASKIWKVSRAELAASLEHQQPGVDLTVNHSLMNRALDDMVKLGYLKSKPAGLLDLSLLQAVKGGL